MALTTLEEPVLPFKPTSTPNDSSPPTTNKPTIHHTTKRGTPTFRTHKLPASGATLPPPTDALTTPIGDPWPRPYHLRDNLRRVEPYHYTYNTYCKERWRGRPILSIFGDEFRDRPIDYYRDAIERGYIAVNGKNVSIEHVLRNGDVVSHTLHRHEPPVTAAEIKTVYEDAEMLVINKPAGVPVHPSGRYNFNSVVEILRAQRNGTLDPLPCNRLDRLTSGIMFIGKTRAAAEKLGNEIRDRAVRKEYIARVTGEFPEGEVLCEKPILQISPKLGLNRVRANGKEARTVFRRLAYYSARTHDANVDNGTRGEHDEAREDMPWRRKSGYSIVRCFPLTGRTHQLRVHLQFLGHPITNDPIYCNQRVFGPSLGQSAATDSDDDSVLSSLSKMGKSEAADAVAYHDEMVEEYNKRKAEKQTGEKCDVCGTLLYSDPGIHELGIYLHALRYRHEDGDWDYRTDLPEWSLPPEGMQGPTRLTEETDPLASKVAEMRLEEQAEHEGNSAKPSQNGAKAPHI